MGLKNQEKEVPLVLCMEATEFIMKIVLCIFLKENITLPLFCQIKQSI
jgi:hypothetical protein